MAELVDAKDLKSFDPKRVVRVQVPPSAQFQIRAISSVGLERYIDIVEVRSSNLLSPTDNLKLLSSMFYVYILENERMREYYTGSTDDVARRLTEHLQGMSRFTRWHKGPWKLIYSETFETRSQAVRREKEIKNKRSRKYIENLVRSQKQIGQLAQLV